MRKTVICICESKDADQIRGNRDADKRLCFCYIDIPVITETLNTYVLST